jgi:hypothetical protein
MTKPYSEMLPIWKERADAIIKDIIRQDLRDIPVYFVRKYNNSEISDDMSWHPDYDPYEQMEKSQNYTFPQKIEYLSYDYYDDRTIKILIDLNFLIKEKTTQYEVVDYTAEQVGNPKSTIPAGYFSYINWVEIEKGNINLVEKSSNIVESNDNNGFIIKNVNDGPCLFLDKPVCKFRSIKNKRFLYFKYCFDNLGNNLDLKEIFENYKKITQAIETYPEMVSEFNKNISKTLKLIVAKINKSPNKGPYVFKLTFKNSGVKLNIIKK